MRMLWDGAFCGLCKNGRSTLHWGVRDGAAAEDGVAVIEDNGLTRGDGALGFVEYHTGHTVFHRIHRCSLFRHSGTGFCFATDGLVEGREGDPVPIEITIENVEDGTQVAHLVPPADIEFRKPGTYIYTIQELEDAIYMDEVA